MLLVGTAVFIVAVSLIGPLSGWLQARTNEANARAEETRARATSYREGTPS